MATRPKPNWKVLDALLPVLEKEGWSHAMIADDWGISLATLEGHLTQEPGMSAISKHDYPALFKEYAQRRASGESHQAIRATFESRGINWGTFQNRRTQAHKAQQGTPVQTPAQTAVQRIDTGPVQPFDTGAVQRLDQLEEEVHTLAHAVRSLADRLNHTPVQTPMQITAVPGYPKGKSVRWNLWILDSIRDEVATLAAERDMSPSQLVQELLWAALRRE